VTPTPGRGVRTAPKTIPIHKGRIVWATITPAKGVRKPRRSVVLMELPAEPAATARRFLVAGVTCDGGEYDPRDSKKYPPSTYFPIPHASDGSSPTTFRLPSAVYAEFVEGFFEHELEATEGFLEAPLLDDLIVKLKAYVARNHV
jgi:hypothetical protein